MKTNLSINPVEKLLTLSFKNKLSSTVIHKMSGKGRLSFIILAIFARNCAMEPSTVCIGENEEYKDCGSSCPPTCENPDPEACITLCVVGCFCKDGYYRDTSTNQCVLLDECPGNPHCEENEIFTECETLCPKSCNNMADFKACPITQCNPGCVCDSGYVLNTVIGKCVLPEDCFVDCSRNETFIDCHGEDRCETKCNSQMNCRFSNDCSNNCVCRTGYFRDDESGLCVKPMDCSNVKKYLH
ncbi:CLUMA_CG002351, isoform A [Clunio marinus]|uniref:CLUMA_CG002351, isoform A n=1 Tax=Clunio marinus TaxID=568069 RepID=A0A1J1HMC1_9DIPT|nr:CLUMA_CG002351, isoform A [Clunio marinus]